MKNLRKRFATWVRAGLTKIALRFVERTINSFFHTRVSLSQFILMEDWRLKGKRMKQLTFVVTIEFPDYLEEQVVRNYVPMAIKKYDKLVIEAKNHSGYFDSCRSYTKFKISEVPPAEDGDLRAVINQIKKVEEHFDRID